MEQISRQQLQQYLTDSLSDAETALIERTLRASEPLRHELRALLQESDRGEHSLGAVWVRYRLSCPDREQLGNYLLQILEAETQDYVEFHLRTIACPFCQANLADLQNLQQAAAPETATRRRRFFESSAGYLQVCRPTKKT